MRYLETTSRIALVIVLGLVILVFTMAMLTLGFFLAPFGIGFFIMLGTVGLALGSIPMLRKLWP